MHRLTEEKYWMGRDVKFKDQLTPEIRSNAKDLIDSVNAVLMEIGWTGLVEVSSGWRPAQINKSTDKAATSSQHLICKAVDLIDDKERTLWKALAAHPEILRKHGLFLEDKDSTKGINTNWCHLDNKKRTDRPSRVFLPK